MRLIGLSLLLVCALCGCTGVDYGVGHVQAVTIEPASPSAGQQAQIFVDLYDPYLYPGQDGAGPRVTLQVTGGTVSGQDWVAGAITSGGWQTQDGQSVIVYPHAAMYWTLPDEPGTYKLTVGFDGDEMIKRVVVK